MTEREQMAHLKVYGSLSAKILKNCVQECDRIGNLLSNEYNNQQKKSGQQLITEGDTLFLLFLREWTDLLYGVKILCGNNLHHNAIPTVRTMYEIFLLMNYLIINNDEMDTKAKCYSVFAVWKKMKNTQKDIQYMKNHPETGKNNLYNPEETYASSHQIFESFSSDPSTKLIKDTIEELDVNGRFYGSWYTVFEHLKNNKVKQYSLRQINITLNERLDGNLFMDDSLTFMYNQLYDFMSQYAHGANLLDRVHANINGNFFSPTSYPKDGFLLISLIQTMFFEIIIIVSKKYFYGKGEEWNSSEKLNIRVNHKKQYKILQKIRELDRKLF